VLHLITTIKRGGAENQLLILVREQIKLGLEVHIAFLKEDPELLLDFEALGAHVHSELSTRSIFTQPLHLRKIIRWNNPVIHAHLPRAELVALFTPKKFKMIVSRHNTEPFFPKGPRIVSGLLSNLVSLRSNSVIAISEAVKRELLDSNEISNTSKIQVVAYGYVQKGIKSQNIMKEDVGLLKLGTISRLTAQKDLPTMLRAFAEVKKMGQGATLSIAGAGDLESTLKKSAESMGIAKEVSFVGRIKNPLEFLGTLDIFLLTSIYEGFGLVLLEAMDAGVPIVASRTSAIPEVLGPDFPGLCEPGDYLDFARKMLMLNDPIYKRRVLEIQRVRLNMFSASQMAKAINDIYVR
jgi:glycosyltransferase involved in cell wall biosynthesis